jgi:CheY-like chemotaxis protein
VTVLLRPDGMSERPIGAGPPIPSQDRPDPLAEWAEPPKARIGELLAALISADHDVGEKAAALGAEGYLRKPLRFPSLLAEVARLVRS